jgi:hypothetical protein
MKSTIVDGAVLDWRFKKRNAFTFAFYIGDIFVGQIFKMRRRWSVVGKSPNILCPIDGLASRADAAELLLKLEGFTKKHDL